MDPIALQPHSKLRDSRAAAAAAAAAAAVPDIRAGLLAGLLADTQAVMQSNRRPAHRTVHPLTPTGVAKSVDRHVKRLREHRREMKGRERERALKKKSFSILRREAGWNSRKSKAVNTSRRTGYMSKKYEDHSARYKQQHSDQSARNYKQQSRWQSIKRRPRLTTGSSMSSTFKGEFALALGRAKQFAQSVKSARFGSDAFVPSSPWDPAFTNRSPKKSSKLVPRINIRETRAEAAGNGITSGKSTMRVSRKRMTKLLQTISDLQQRVSELETENRRLRSLNQGARGRADAKEARDSNTGRRSKKRVSSRGRSSAANKIAQSLTQSLSLVVGNARKLRSRDSSRQQPSRHSSSRGVDSAAVAEKTAASVEKLATGAQDDSTAPSDYDEWEQSSSDEMVQTSDGERRARMGFNLDLSRVNLKGARALADITDQNTDPAASFEITDSGTYRQGNFSLNKHGIRVETGARSAAGGLKSSTRRTGISSDDLVVLRVLGRGSSAVVYKCFNTAKHEYVALKVINIFEQEKRRQLAKELRTLTSTASMKNPFLIGFYGAYFEEGSISLVLEYMDNGSLQDLIERTGRGLPERLIVHIAKQVLQGLSVLHSSKLIHRDLKPANILLDTKGRCKISDFGILANVKDSQDSMELSECKTFVGTLYYMSPERLEGKKYSYGSDIWAFGLTILACAIGRHPITSKDHLDLMSKFKCLPKIIESHAAMRNVTPVFADFLTRCVDMDPGNRPSCTALLEHRFVASVSPAVTSAAALRDSPHWFNESDEGRPDAKDLARICDKYVRKQPKSMSGLPEKALQSLKSSFSLSEKALTIIFQKRKGKYLLST